MFTKIRLRLDWWWGDLRFNRAVKIPDSRKGKVEILCFHGLCPDNESFINGRFYHLSRFRELVSTLAEQVHFLSLDDWLNNDLHPQKLNLLLTFDDGYRNNKTLLVPILEELQVPAVLFVTDGVRPLWPDLFDIAAAVGLLTPSFFDFIPEWKNEPLKHIKQHFVKSSPEKADYLTNALLELLPEQVLHDYSVFYELLSDEDVRQLAIHPLIQFANHTANHYYFPSLKQDGMLTEITSVIECLCAVGVPEQHAAVVAYPFSQFSEETAAVLKSNGFSKQLLAGNPGKAPEGILDRLTVNPFISVQNMVRMIIRGKY
jgi:peptidoglycan/xylan/chitin deacetylase (PgdA/CDA1 family)